MQIRKLFEILRLLSWGGRPSAWSLVWTELKRRCYSDELSVGFQLDLTRTSEGTAPEGSLAIRELSSSDVPLLLDFRRRGLDAVELRAILMRHLLVEARLPTCYVGIDVEKRPCCMCWLARAEDNDRYRTYFGEGYQPLRPGEVLCEEIYTHPDHRGRRLMKHLTRAVLEIAATQDGARRALAFIRADNRQSLAGASVTGWEPFVYRQVSWRLFRRRRRFESVFCFGTDRVGVPQAQPRPARV